MFLKFIKVSNTYVGAFLDISICSEIKSHGMREVLPFSPKWPSFAEFRTLKTANSLAPFPRELVEADSLSLAPWTHSSPKLAHGQLVNRSPAPLGPPPALHRAANDRQGMENAPQRGRDSGTARRGSAAERPEGGGGRRPDSSWGPGG